LYVLCEEDFLVLYVIFSSCLLSNKIFILLDSSFFCAERLVYHIKVDIIGAGPGGLSAATSIKKHDPRIDVIVHEKYKIIGYNHEGRRCGEAHSVEREWTQWVPVGPSIFNPILHAEVTIGKYRYVAQRPPNVAFVLNRQEFICQLARDAEKKGVEFKTNDRIRSVDDLEGDVIVDASGCPSVVKRELGLGTGFIGATYQETLEDANCFQCDTIRIIFSIPAGYYWIFPRNPQKKEVNIGIGTFGDYGYDLRKMLDSFKKQQQVTGKINYVVGGLIPLGLQRPFLYRNILFVGDAGVGAFPFSGQGIYRALLSGDIAGRCIAQNKLKKYPAIIRKEFMQWDVIGQVFAKMNMVFRRINPALFLSSINFLVRQGKQLSLLTH
jgi:flavin-dependent dehydrogenase